MEHWSLEQMMAFGKILNEPQLSSWSGLMKTYTNGHNEPRINNNFKYHPPKDDQTQRYEVIRQCAQNFAHLINELSPGSREQSEAFTCLENTVMWTNAAIARNE